MCVRLCLQKGPGDDAQDRGEDMYDDNDDDQDGMHLAFAPPMPPYPNQHHNHNKDAGFDDIPLLAKEDRRISEAYAAGGAWRGLGEAMAAYGRSLKALVTMEGFPSLSVTMLAQDYLVQVSWCRGERDARHWTCLSVFLSLCLCVSECVSC